MILHLIQWQYGILSFHFICFRPYSGKFLRMKEDGVYTCVVCDNPLFRSDQKYESGCGWPSFHDVMAHGKVTLTRDTSHGQFADNFPYLFSFKVNYPHCT